MAIRHCKVLLFIAIILSVLLFGSSFVSAGDNNVKPFLKDINQIVQLKDNGWIKMVDEIYWEETWGEREKRQGIDKNPWPPELAKNVHRNLTVKFQFLKKSNATTLIDEWKAENKERLKDYKPDNIIPLQLLFAGEKGKIVQAYFGVQSLMNAGKTKEAQQLFSDSLDKYPSFSDCELPRFKSDYHTKIFVTFFSKDGLQVKITSEYPIAYWVDEKQTQRKKEMLPGETTYLDFSIPDEAVDWYVWVPK